MLWNKNSGLSGIWLRCLNRACTAALCFFPSQWVYSGNNNNNTNNCTSNCASNCASNVGSNVALRRGLLSFRLLDRTVLLTCGTICMWNTYNHKSCQRRDDVTSLTAINRSFTNTLHRCHLGRFIMSQMAIYFEPRGK